MSVELIPDAERPHGWWLLVDGSEQSFVDLDDPEHLEFEYVQLAAHIVDLMLDQRPADALHLGGGLLTIPRWLAARRPHSRQTVAEHSGRIAELAASLGPVPGVTVELADALDVLRGAAPASLDLVVGDVYDGPETVTALFTLSALTTVSDRLRRDGLLVCNLSDATPFALTKAVTATVRAVFAEVVLLAEPPVLRGRRSGNVVLGAAHRAFPLRRLSRRAAAGPVRGRLLSGTELDDFVGRALPVADESDLPRSGESTGRPLR